MNYGIYEVTILFMDRAPQGPLPLTGVCAPPAPSLQKTRENQKLALDFVGVSGVVGNAALGENLDEEADDTY